MIHVFNNTSSALHMSVNGAAVPAPEGTTPDNGYQPFSKLFELRKFFEPGVFSPGENTVDVQFRDFKPPLPSSACYPVHVPRDTSIQLDFVLFLFVNGAVLMRPSGEIVENDFHPARQPTDSEQSDPTATEGAGK